MSEDMDRTGQECLQERVGRIKSKCVFRGKWDWSRMGRIVRNVRRNGQDCSRVSARGGGINQSKCVFRSICDWSRVGGITQECLEEWTGLVKSV